VHISRLEMILTNSKIAEWKKILTHYMKQSPSVLRSWSDDSKHWCCALDFKTTFFKVT
jgi:hypothetical protein